jgi:Tol biopolymer transport system component
MGMTRAVIVALAVAVAALLAWPALAQGETVDLVSVGSGGSQGNYDSWDASISADGSIVAFTSEATNLVPPDANGENPDVFVRDVRTAATELVSVASDGTQGDGGSSEPSISADGSIVAFMSYSGNLWPEGELSGFWAEGEYHYYGNIYVHYLLTGATELVSVNPAGTGGANGNCFSPSLSADGSCVAFASQATNLVEGDENGYCDIFVRHLAGDFAGTTELVSVSSEEVQAHGDSYAPSIDADGSTVAFQSTADNLVDEDLNGSITDVFVRYLAGELAGTTDLVSVSSDEAQGNFWSSDPSINADGSIVAFTSLATNLTEETITMRANVFVRYLAGELAGTTELVSVSSDGTESDGASMDASISANGSMVAFASSATDLVTGDTNDCADVFVRNLLTRTTRLLSGSWNGSPADGDSKRPSINADGSIVAFESEATNLVQGDANDRADVFVTRPIAKPAGGYPNRYEQTDPRILYSGQWETGINKSHSGGSNYFTNDKTATITITFKGTRLDWIAALGPLMGKALVSIDGGEPVLVDLYSDTELFQQLVWSTGELEYGVHTVTITFPQGSDYQEGQGINIDALDVWGALLQTTES